MNVNTDKPKAIDNLTAQDLGDETILYDSKKENVHILNETACVIWGLCDGKHTIEDMQRHLEEQFPDVKKEELNNDIMTTLKELQEKKLFV
jgi:hypothetical protein